MHIRTVRDTPAGVEVLEVVLIPKHGRSDFISEYVADQWSSEWTYTFSSRDWDIQIETGPTDESVH